MAQATADSKNYTELLSEQVRVERARRQLSQAELAREAGVGLNRVGEIERGGKTVTLRTAARIARAIGMRIALVPVDQ